MGKASEHLAALVARCESTDPDEATTNESPLSLEVQGKYVDVLFTTGGPHFEVQLSYVDAGDAEYWFENEPNGGTATYLDWSESDVVRFGRYEAAAIAHAITRDPDELGEV